MQKMPTPYALGSRSIRTVRVFGFASGMMQFYSVVRSRSERSPLFERRVLVNRDRQGAGVPSHPLPDGRGSPDQDVAASRRPAHSVSGPHERHCSAQPLAFRINFTFLRFPPCGSQRCTESATTTCTSIACATVRRLTPSRSVVSSATGTSVLGPTGLF